MLVAGCVPRSGMSFMQIPIFKSTSAELSLSQFPRGQFDLYLSEPIYLVPASLKQFPDTFVHKTAENVTPLQPFQAGSQKILRKNLYFLQEFCSKKY